jgi:hypothetical protein
MFVLNFLVICRVYGDTIQVEVVTLLNSRL